MVPTPANQDAADSPQGGTLTKAAILAELRSQLSARLVTAQQAAADAFAAATHEEARAENKYDTRALEQSYLSAGAKCPNCRASRLDRCGSLLPPAARAA